VRRAAATAPVGVAWRDGAVHHAEQAAQWLTALGSDHSMGVLVGQRQAGSRRALCQAGVRVVSDRRQVFCACQVGVPGRIG
jgi:hypothetical protein